MLLADQASTLYDAGLRRLNIHLDTLIPRLFEHITRRDDFDRVMDGIEACLALGFASRSMPSRLKGVNEDDIVPLARFGREHGIEVRYIEFMPLDSQGIWDRDRVLLADEMIAMLTREIGPLEAVPDPDPRAPATEYRFADGIGRSDSSPRQQAVLPELQPDPADRRRQAALLPVRDRRDRREAAAARRRIGSQTSQLHFAAISPRKWMGHEINQAQFVPPPRPMYAIGG